MQVLEDKSNSYLHGFIGQYYFCLSNKRFLEFNFPQAKKASENLKQTPVKK